MLLIPILPATLDLITKLNDGVTPELTDNDHVYVWRGDGAHAEILTRDEITQSADYPNWVTQINVFYIAE